MKIKRLKLKNWKNFTDVDVALASRSFIVGPNASGKSNLLDSLRFLHDISRPGKGLAKALSDRGGLKKIRSLSARNEPQVEIKIELEESEKSKVITWTYHLSLINEVRGKHRTLIHKEQVIKNDVIILDRPDSDDKVDSLRLTQTGLEQINVNSSFRELYTHFQDIGYIHLIPQLIREPELFFNTNIKLDDDSYGFHFLESIVNTSAQQKKHRLKKIEKVFRTATLAMTTQLVRCSRTFVSMKGPVVCCVQTVRNKIMVK